MVYALKMSKGLKLAAMAAVALETQAEGRGGLEVGRGISAGSPRNLAISVLASVATDVALVDGVDLYRAEADVVEVVTVYLSRTVAF